VDAKLWIDENGIIREQHESAVITWETAMGAAAERARLAGEKKMPLLVEFKKMFAFSTETRELPTDVILKNVSALGYLVLDGSIGQSQQLTIRNYFEKTPWPIAVDIFFNMQEALAWLKEYAETAN